MQIVEDREIGEHANRDERDAVRVDVPCVVSCACMQPNRAKKMERDRYVSDERPLNRPDGMALRLL